MRYNVKVEDLSEEKQRDYFATLSRLGRSEEWGACALQLNPLENWEKWGFGCFETDWVQVKASKMCGKKARELTVDTLNADFNEFKRYVKSLVAFTNELEERVADLEREVRELKNAI